MLGEERRRIAMIITSINCCCLDEIAIVAPPSDSHSEIITNCFFRTPPKSRESKMNIKTKDGKIIINIEY